MDRLFNVQVLSQSHNPQQLIYAAMHQDYCESFVWEERDLFPDEDKAGEVIIKHLLAGNRGHYGPLEHPQIVFNCGYFPHSTMQQIRTHRVGMCLSGDTEVYTKTKGGAIKKLLIRDLYNRWTKGRPHQNSESDAAYSRRRISSIPVYNLDEETLEFGVTHISNVYSNGTKTVFLVKTSEGQTIKASSDHLFFTNNGWVKLGNLSPGDLITTRCFSGRNKRPSVPPIFAGDLDDEVWKAIPRLSGYEASSLGRIRSWHSKNGKGLTDTPRVKDLSASAYLFYSANGKRRNVHVDVLAAFRGDKPDSKYVARHLDGNAYNNRIENLAWGTENQNREDQGRTTGFNCCKARFVPIVSIENAGEEETYDLEVVGPYHNFLANDLVVHNSFDVQSFRYTGRRIYDLGKLCEANYSSFPCLREAMPKGIDIYINEVFYVRPVGCYTDRSGKHYEYTEEMRLEDLVICGEAAIHYSKRIDQGLSEEHARGLIPFDVRQHWVMSANVRSLMHLLDLRWKLDAQLEAQQLCELIWPEFKAWVPNIAEWYETNRAKKARLAP